mgnify:CR=1 FL=1
MKKISGLFFLILILATIAGGLIFWRLFLYQPPVPAEIPGPTPTPTQFFLPSPTAPQEGKGESPTDLFRSLKEKFPLAAFLPYENENFSIDYAAPLSLKVEIKIATQTAQTKKEVLDWIWSKGVNPSTHQIKYLTPEP